MSSLQEKYSIAFAPAKVRLKKDIKEKKETLLCFCGELRFRLLQNKIHYKTLKFASYLNHGLVLPTNLKNIPNDEIFYVRLKFVFRDNELYRVEEYLWHH